MTEQAIPASQVRERKEDLFTAKPWQLVWRRFSKHTLAVVSMWFLGFRTGMNRKQVEASLGRPDGEESPLKGDSVRERTPR